jgi:outer membrane protein OmpA-like peptidoglycan-associated protein
MGNKLTKALVTMCVGTVLLSPGARAEPGTAIYEIPDKELTAERLISVLQPPGPTRGIDSSAAGKAAPSCGELRKRGIDADAVADIAAIKVTFAFNSAELTPAAAENLNKLGQALKSDGLAPYCFRIEGHADAVGGEGYNQALSEKRAGTVVHYLSGRLGVDAERLIAVGYGETKPVADNDTEEGRQRNRRVQVVNLGDGAAAQ